MAETKTPSDKIEREYIIPLRHRWSIVPRYKRTNKAVKSVKEFIARHMKIRDRDLDKIKLDRYLNETLWHRGIRNPPSRIKVKAIKEGEIVRVTAVDLPNNIKFKKLREEKLIGTSKKVADKRKEERKQEEKEMPKVEQESEKKAEEEKENKSAIVEAGREMEKAAAKQMKHQSKQDIKQQQQKHQRRMALEK